MPLWLHPARTGERQFSLTHSRCCCISFMLRHLFSIRDRNALFAVRKDVNTSKHHCFSSFVMGGWSSSAGANCHRSHFTVEEFRLTPAEDGRQRRPLLVGRCISEGGGLLPCRVWGNIVLLQLHIALASAALCSMQLWHGVDLVVLIQGWEGWALVLPGWLQRVPFEGVCAPHCVLRTPRGLLCLCVIFYLSANTIAK